MHGLDRVIVNSAACLLAYQSHLAKHLKTVTQHVDLAAFIMVPANWYFLHSQPGASCHVEQFNVETETIDGCSFDDGTADAHTKRFETALCVPEGKTGCQPHNEVENSATLFAPPWLVHANQASVQCSRPEGQIAFATQDWLDQFCDFPDRRRKVGVREQRHITTRGQ